MIRIVALLTILFVGIIAARAARTLIDRAFYEARAFKIVRMNVGFLISRIVEYAIYTAMIILIANDLGITNIALIIIAVIIGILVLGNLLTVIIFAIPNFLARFGSLERKLTVGAKIDHMNIKGTVVKKSWTDLVVKTETNELMIIPYRSLND